MRSKFFFAWAGLRWLLLMFLVAAVLEAPATEKTQEPPQPIRSWTVLSSWYGPGFHGKVTASGEIYDMNGPTAAHPTLPMGSVVRVVNIRNGRSRVLRINDRGPFIEGRELDLSYEAARYLGLDGRGVGRVRIELLQVPERRAKRPLQADRSTGL
jgi:rare lipoprotein A (peptidoglycan hydrolase)